MSAVEFTAGVIASSKGLIADGLDMLGIPEVAGGLVGMGYRLAAGHFEAAEVGAPHRRERLFILAHRERDDLADPPREREREPADEGRRRRRRLDSTA